MLNHMAWQLLRVDIIEGSPSQRDLYEEEDPKLVGLEP